MFVIGKRFQTFLENMSSHFLDDILMACFVSKTKNASSVSMLHDFNIPIMLNAASTFKHSLYGTMEKTVHFRSVTKQAMSLHKYLCKYTQVINSAAKTFYMSGGRSMSQLYSADPTGLLWAAQHSQYFAFGCCKHYTSLSIAIMYYLIQTQPTASSSFSAKVRKHGRVANLYAVKFEEFDKDEIRGGIQYLVNKSKLNRCPQEFVISLGIKEINGSNLTDVAKILDEIIT
ncbi:hypothetical protein GQX74_009269 [Glossina fuscipes]|nr:hypothetical protein GQX74_009269 [Glossina fuscipes]